MFILENLEYIEMYQEDNFKVLRPVSVNHLCSWQVTECGFEPERPQRVPAPLFIRPFTRSSNTDPLLSGFPGPQRLIQCYRRRICQRQM